MWLRLGHMMWPRTISPQTKLQAIPILNPVEPLDVNFRIISECHSYVIQSPRARHSKPMTPHCLHMSTSINYTERFSDERIHLATYKYDLFNSDILYPPLYHIICHKYSSVSILMQPRVFSLQTYSLKKNGMLFASVVDS